MLSYSYLNLLNSIIRRSHSS
uniref:Uncharacterized protein n=1 Tax=Rhizophora mucronata TaxID=61149 RepID=A0A2P2NCR9_RHIMU